jgi:homoserine kinase
VQIYRVQQTRIRASGRDAHLIPTNEDNLIWQTARAVAARANRPLPAVDLEIINNIPLGKGLGSSAAALIAGVIMAERLLELRWSSHRILDEAARIEGHPDNVAACVLGSVVASAVDPGGIARAVRIPMPHNIEVAVVAPDYAVPTKIARSVLPEHYSMADTVWNVQRASLLIAGLASGDTSVFPTALDDRMHQPYRMQLVPGLTEILRLRAPGLLGCAMSGAGPAVLVFFEKGFGHVVELVRQTFAMNGSTTEVVATGVSVNGFEFLSAA